MQNKKLRVASFLTRQASGQLFKKVQASIQGLLLSKAFARESDARSEFQALSYSTFDHSLSLRTRVAAMKAVTTVTLAIVLLSTDFFAATYVFSEQSIFGASLLVFLGLTSRFWSIAVYQARRGNAESIQVTLEELVNYWCLAQDMAVGLGRTWELLAHPTGVGEPKAPKNIPDKIRRLDLSDINYSHNKKLTLNGITLRIESGHPHLLVGPSGAGKSTLLSLLLRLDDPEDGGISLDGLPINNVRLSDLRHAIGIVLQESTVLPLTLRENIEYTASDSLSDLEMGQIIKIACLESVVDSLPNGLDTDLGVDGGLLSTGQRQQVAIARMIAADPKIILLDEPTASLDSKTEEQVLRNLLAWAKEKIVLIVSHQLDIVKSVKRISVIDQGEIIAQGGHRDLIESCELYRVLCNGGVSNDE
jgi:ATP-binding cassette subfamily B protein